MSHSTLGNKKRILLHRFSFFVLGLTLSVQSTSQAAPSTLQRYEAKLNEACTKNTKRSKICLAIYLVYKCRIYGNFFALPTQATKTGRCINASISMIEEMDITQFISVPLKDIANAKSANAADKSHLFLKQLFYTKKLVALFKRPDTGTKFRALKTEMETSYAQGKYVTLWDVVKKMHRGNADAALEFMSVALQDVSSMKTAPVLYLEMEYEKKHLPENSVELENLRSADDFFVFLFKNKTGSFESGLSG